MSLAERASNLAELRESGWQSRTVKEELRENFQCCLAKGDETVLWHFGLRAHCYSGNQSGFAGRA